MSSTAPPKLDVSKFVDYVERSKIVDPDVLQRALKSVELTTAKETRTASSVADQLVTAGVLTRWQARQLLAAKYRGFKLGKYFIRRPLGKGGMAVVYEAEHAVLGTKVAIKVLPKAKSDLERAVSRFLAEAKAAAKLIHPNIVRVHDFDSVDGRQFMVMDLVQGSDLASHVDRSGPVEIKHALILLRQAAAGLGYAHDQGVTHRDVKPSNFLIDRSGVLKVADMGLALFEIDKPDRHTRETDSSVLGTIDYVAPEQAWDSRKVDRRADIYSLGCTLYFMLTGKAPFENGTLAQRIAMHQTAQATPLTELRADCPPAVWQLCEHMMAKLPQDRFQRMSQVVDACNQILATLGGSSSGSSPAMPIHNEVQPVAGSSEGSTDLSMNPLQESLRAIPNLDDLGDLSDTGTALSDTQPNLQAGAQTLTSSDPSAAAQQNNYWNSTQPKPRNAKSSGQLYTIVAAVIGIALSLTALAIVVSYVFFPPEENKGGKVYIKNYETENGSVVIVREKDD